MACSGITVTRNSLYATVSLIDEGGRVFSINNALGPENFKIFETYKSKKNGPLTVRAVVPLLDTKTQIKILFVLDNSLSMFEPVPNLVGINKIDIAKNSLIFLLNGLKDSLAGGLNALVSVLAFDGKSCKFICDPFGNRWLSDFELLSSEIKNIQRSEADTLLWDTLSYSIDYMNQEIGYRAIICLTDGQDNISVNINCEGLIQRFNSVNIPMFSVCYGDATDYVKLANLSKVSGAGDEGVGSFIDYKYESLPNIFKDIGDSIIASYVISWLSDTINIATEGKVIVNVNVKYNSFEASFEGRSYDIAKESDNNEAMHLSLKT
jgi:hypothetical protein